VLSTSLHVNFHKTTLVLINLDHHQANLLANSFSCKVESLSFTYLDLPLGTTRPSVAELMPLVSRLEKRLFGISYLMTYTRRLTLLNSVIKFLPMYHSLCPFWKSGRQFLWVDKEDKIHGKCLASCEMIYKPKDQGWLGILDLRTKNKALLLKNLHKFYHFHDIPWVNNGQTPSMNSNKGSFWWRDLFSHDDLFKEHTTVSVKSGKTCLLWKDKWIVTIREDDYPHLHSFAIDKNIYLLEKLGISIMKTAMTCSILTVHYCSWTTSWSASRSPRSKYWFWSWYMDFPMGPQILYQESL
jgi:hypothetical protein